MARVAKGLRIAQKIKFAARFSPESFEEIRALAERYVRFGLREGQSLHVTECVAQAEFNKRRREQ